MKRSGGSSIGLAGPFLLAFSVFSGGCEASDATGHHAIAPSCVVCETLDGLSGTLQYTGEDVRRMASGHWEGTYEVDDEFGPFTLGLDVEFLDEEATETDVSTPVGSPPDCYAPAGSDDPEYCVALVLRARVTATIDTDTLPNLPDGQTLPVHTQGRELACDQPRGFLPKGCPGRYVQDVRKNGDNAAIVFGSEERFWIGLPGDSEGEMNYTMIGRRTSVTVE